MMIMEGRKRSLQIFSVLCVSLASLTVGFASGWTSPVIPKLIGNQTHIEITEAEVSWVVALNSPGNILGTILTIYMCDNFGRRATLLVGSLHYIVGSLLAVFTTSVWVLYFTMFMWGCGTGIIAIVVPIYIAEIADKNIRGTLILTSRIFFNVGILFVMTSGSFMPYVVINSILLVFSVIAFLGCLQIPESPYHYLRAGRIEKAEKTFVRFKGPRNMNDNEDEWTTMKSCVQNDMKFTSVWVLFTGRQYRKAIIISAGLKITSTASGVITLRQYLGPIMKESKTTLTLSVVLIAFGVVNFILGFMSTVLVDRLGRRPLLYCSYLAAALSLLVVGGYFFCQEVLGIDQTTLQYFSFIPFVGIVIANIVASLGYKCLVFMIPSELFPVNVKCVALTTLNIFGYVVSFFTSLGYQKIKDWTGLSFVFLCFAVVALIGAVFSVVYVPETKNKSLEEIQFMLQKGDAVYVKDNSLSICNEDDKAVEHIILKTT